MPGLQEGYRLIKRDEGRHVSFGMRCIAELTTAHPELKGVVQGVFDRHLPNVLATVQEFDYPTPIVDLDKLTAYALAQYERFAAAAGLGDDAVNLEALAAED